MTDQLHFSQNLHFSLGHAEVEELLTTCGYTNLRLNVEHNCGLTGYTAKEWLAEDSEGNTVRAEMVLSDLVTERLKALLLGREP
jgi:hypothetical protein